LGPIPNPQSPIPKLLCINFQSFFNYEIININNDASGYLLR
jgi:hypothetical protein